MPCWVLLVVVIKGMLEDAKALGPTFSNQVWSTIWLATVCPNTRLSFGVKR